MPFLSTCLFEAVSQTSLQYAMGIKMKGVTIEVWGDYALFTRPEMKVERVSYDVITPSAARGILDAIFWNPGMKWVIDKIYVMNPIEFSNIRRNEIKSKISARNVENAMNDNSGNLYISTVGDMQQRASTLLINVRYRIQAHFELTEESGKTNNDAKFYAIIMRRLRYGQCFHQPCLGCREFPAHFRLVEKTETTYTAYPDTDMDLGYVLYDMDYSIKDNILPRFFRARMKRGIIDLRECEVVQ